MQNWQIALINETRQRQEQIAAANLHRLAMQVPPKQTRWNKFYQNLLIRIGELLIKFGTRLQTRYTKLTTQPGSGTKISTCP